MHESRFFLLYYKDYAMLPYALSIFLSAFLVFVVELLIGKFILPWFGGTPSVWTTCLMFFQLILLGGYAYSYWVAGIKKPLKQRNTHIALLVVSLIWIGVFAILWGSPLLPSANLRPEDSSLPVFRIVLLLFLSIGLPFFILSANGPLVQAWFSRVFPKARTYRLYSLSNFGSLLGLVTYPILIEPYFNLKNQAIIWSIGFLSFAILTVFCAIMAARICNSKKSTAPKKTKAVKTAGTVKEKKLSSVFSRILWVILPACASVMLMASTNQMCQEVAVIPFLWVLPLVLYLLSFIIAFDNEKWYRRSIFLPAFALAAIGSCYILSMGYSSSIILQISVYCFTIFICAMVCHGELARLKPGMNHLTLFYLLVSTGGALGGIFVAIAAPLFFPGFWEFQIGLWLIALLILLLLLREKESWIYRKYPWPAVLVLFTFVLLKWIWDQYDSFDSLNEFLSILFDNGFFPILFFGILLLFAVDFFLTRKIGKRIPWIAVSSLSASVIILGWTLGGDIKKMNNEAVKTVRNFFGVLTIQEFDVKNPLLHRLILKHGQISHGMQYQASNKKKIITTYYHHASGIGRAIITHPKYTPKKNIRIGVIGLGVGTIAAYGRPGDYFRFYEINPLVAEASFGKKASFSFLNNCKGKVDLIMGDARISMERELKENKRQNFDIVAVDAFSSDSIPVHLLTKEAIEIYFKHLNRDTGILAIHITNRHLNLQPIVWQLTDTIGLKAVLIDDDSNTPVEWGSTWMLLSKNKKILNNPIIANALSKREKSDKKFRMWTDDYSNLFQIIK
jgi:spermidine synthase